MSDDSSSSKKQNLFSRWRRRAYRLFSNDAEQEWQDLLEEHLGEDEDSLTEHERSLVSAALQLDTLVAEDVSVPRSDIISIKLGSSFADVLETFKDSRKARLLVIGENLDDVRGFLSLKDVVAFVGREKAFKLENLLRPATFVPESLSVDRVLQLLKKKRAAIAVVTDEYGGTAGLLTLKDILEELVGDLEDEDPVDTPTGPLPLSDGRYQLDPKMEMEDFRAFFQLPDPMDEEDFETVSGYILALAGRVPENGDVIEAPDGLFFTITESDGRRISKLTVKRATT